MNLQEMLIVLTESQLQKVPPLEESFQQIILQILFFSAAVIGPEGLTVGASVAALVTALP